jgi:branched-chain amino acid aminotransferase
VVSQQVDPARPLAAAKTANYLASLVALAQARAAGGDEALLLGPRGDAVEAATANLFAVVDGRLLTPPLAAGPLPGVTREVVLECARSLGLPAPERRLPRALLARADEVFLTNSVSGVRAVAAIEGWWIAATVPGPHTYALATAYRDLVARECKIAV